MKVYVLEFGCYSDRWISGVFDSLEAAKAAADERAAASYRPLVNEWTEDTYEFRVATNNHDMDDAATIYELPVRSLAEVLGMA